MKYTLEFDWILHNSIHDSLYSSIPMLTADQIINLVHRGDNNISIRSMNMQQQNGTSDCGLFAISVATAICYYFAHPQLSTWAQEEMRGHLVRSLEAERITPFPTTNEDTKQKGVVKKALYH